MKQRLNRVLISNEAVPVEQPEKSEDDELWDSIPVVGIDPVSTTNSRYVFAPSAPRSSCHVLASFHSLSHFENILFFLCELSCSRRVSVNLKYHQIASSYNSIYTYLYTLYTQTHAHIHAHPSRPSLSVCVCVCVPCSRSLLPLSRNTRQASAQIQTCSFSPSYSIRLSRGL